MHQGVFPHTAFRDYALLDSGRGEKLERFGGVVVRRPDPQALWPHARTEAAWREADLTFVPDEGSGGRGGKWATSRVAHGGILAVHPEWSVRCGDATLLARPTPFKHVGIFPEQSANWELVRSVRQKIDAEEPRLLNLFGYTGAASILALRSEYEVTHVDASKKAIGWARENQSTAGMESLPIRSACSIRSAFPLPYPGSWRATPLSSAAGVSPPFPPSIRNEPGS